LLSTNIAAAGDKNTPGTLERLLNIDKGAQELRFIGGSEVLARRIAASLGDDVILSAPVREIDWSGDTVIITADGHTI
jgi:monoamine oxidase